MATITQIQRLRFDWERMAGEAVEVEEISGTFYGFCSELGALRIAYQYRHGDSEAYKAAYSENKKTWFFRLEAKQYLQN